MSGRLMVDLFAGLGGASEAFRRAGWRVVTLDVEPMFKPDILADVAAFEPPADLRPDFVWASPPCVEYALRRFNSDLEPSLALVQHAKRIIDKLSPRYWALENVRLSVPFIRQVLGPHRIAAGPYFLWGNFPRFIPSPVPNKGSASGPHYLRSALRAKIPLSLSQDMEAAVTYMLRAAETNGMPGSLLDAQWALPLGALAVEPATRRPADPALDPRICAAPVQNRGLFEA